MILSNSRVNLIATQQCRRLNLLNLCFLLVLLLWTCSMSPKTLIVIYFSLCKAPIQVKFSVLNVYAEILWHRGEAVCTDQFHLQYPVLHSFFKNFND